MKLKVFVILITLFSPFAVAANWDGTVTGIIKQIDVESINGDNAGFRVVLQGSELRNSPALCGNKHTWAYINQSDSNYQTVVSVLLAAKMANKSVTIYSTKDISPDKYCHIGYISLE